MLHFLQNFVYYMTVEVISPRAHEMTAGDVWPIIIYIYIYMYTCMYILACSTWSYAYVYVYVHMNRIHG